MTEPKTQTERAKAFLERRGYSDIREIDYIAEDATDFAASEVEAATRGLREQLEAADETNRYARAVFRALDRYTFEDSDHGRLIAEAVKKLEDVADATGQYLKKHGGE